MLNIDENKLKLLLEQNRTLIERKRYDGLGEIISSISLMITLILADFSQLTIIKPLYFKIVAWGIATVILIYGSYIFIRSINIYSINQLYSEIADIDPKIEHSFNIVVIRNNIENGKYLLFKSQRWRCWLFPNYHCSSGSFNKTKELKHLKEYIKRDLKLSEAPELKYIGNEISEKYSVGDKVRKKYNFHYFEALCLVSDFNNKRTFSCNGRKYCWKTLYQMNSNKNIVKKNSDVLDYIRRMCDIS